MTKIAFTVRLEGKEIETYNKYKDKLEETTPNLSHSQIVASLLKEVEQNI